MNIVEFAQVTGMIIKIEKRFNFKSWRAELTKEDCICILKNSIPNSKLEPVGLGETPENALENLCNLLKGKVLNITPEKTEKSIQIYIPEILSIE